MNADVFIAAVALMGVRVGGTLLLLAGAWYVLRPKLAPALRRTAPLLPARRSR